jgi:hypothetical protein
MFPSWMRSRNDMPRPMYFLAMLTTRRRFASVSWRRASSSPCSIAIAYSTSCSLRSRGTRPISRRYMRTGSSRAIAPSASEASRASSLSSSMASKSRSPSETSMPMSRKSWKMRSRWSGSASISGKPVRTSSGVR